MGKQFSGAHGRGVQRQRVGTEPSRQRIVNPVKAVQQLSAMQDRQGLNRKQRRQYAKARQMEDSVDHS